MTVIDQLYEAVQTRKRPEDVADIVLQAIGDNLVRKDRRKLQSAARYSLRQQAHHYTSMLEDFARPVGMARQVKVATDLFATAPTLTEEEKSDPVAVQEFVKAISPEIKKAFGRSDFKHDRLNREQRRKVGLAEISKRQYNKRFRLLGRMEAKLLKLAREVQKYEFTRIGKSRLATHLSKEQLAEDLDSACFIAYYTARLNRRSLFTWGKQERAYDEICEVLFQRLHKHDGTNWYAIAHVHPDAGVIKHLYDQEKGQLLGKWFGTLQEIGELLRQIWSESEINSKTMIVRRGNDSTTWNNTASAWNKARDAWISLNYAMGMEDVLDQMCFGKVLRLMAADVAWMHQRYGSGDLEPDTGVWNDLPFPWEVLSGQVACTKDDVIKACKARGVDPHKKGWIRPRPKHIAEFTPTPELVHGVVVSNPQFAKLLRKARVFSGKNVRWEELDKHGEFAHFTKTPIDEKMVVT